VAGLVPVVLAVTQGPVELVAVLIALLVGTAYSSPPVRLKRFPAAASLSISLVRGLVVNLGVYLHFAGSLGSRAGASAIPGSIWALTAFVLAFSFAIGILKDVPDAEGDRRFAIATFTVRLGARPVLRAGVAVLTAAYVGMAALGPLLLDGVQPVVLAVSHVLPPVALGAWSRAVDPADRASVTRFYMRVWALFFLEYLTLPLACLAA
jgi:homogentisate phytyltransferase/homogentisate geranylgeranyltransferase